MNSAVAAYDFSGVMQMNCQWESLLEILPKWIIPEVEKSGASDLQEIRLRKNASVELIGINGYRWIPGKVSGDDLEFCVNMASRYSPWANESISCGYITASGGHRIGVCGEAVYKNHQLTGFRNITSLCIRIGKDYPGIANLLMPVNDSVIILGAPGWGKTTLLRDLIRKVSLRDTVCVVDERKELFPLGFQKGHRMDVLSGIKKTEGMEMAVRTMGPSYVAVDEITDFQDAQAMLRIYGCGVHILATAHAGSFDDFMRREIYKPLVTNKVFQTVVVLRSDKSFFVERTL